MEGLSGAEDHSVLAVRERHHRQFDDLVAFGIEPGGLDVDEQAGLGGGAVGGVDLGAGDELSQDAVIAGRFQGRGHRLETRIHFHAEVRRVANALQCDWQSGLWYRGKQKINCSPSV